jgi:hypothetical protein
MARQAGDQRVGSIGRKVLGDLEACDKVETTPKVERPRQVVRYEGVRGQQELPPVDVLAVDTDHVGNAGIHKRTCPRAHPTTHVEHGTGGEELEQQRDHTSRRPTGLIQLLLKEAAAVRANIDVPVRHRLHLVMETLLTSPRRLFICAFTNRHPCSNGRMGASDLVATLEGRARRTRNAAWVLAAATIAVGAAYAFVVPTGLPYDEPAHWSTVIYYADHARMPVLGDPGVTYEAQMGPVAYVLDAAVVRTATATGLSAETAFRVIRMLGVLELSACALLLAALLRGVIARPWALWGAVGLFALNPMLLTMSASVQNDTLALMLAFAALELSVRGDDPSTVRLLLAGGVAGLAVLTKLTAWPVVLAVPLWLAWRHRRGAAQPIAGFLGMAGAVGGWWFVRNVVLYGDLTGDAAVSRAGVTFGRYRVDGIGSVTHVAQQVVTYLWLPTEYLRNTISAPAPLKAFVLLLTLALLALGAHRWRRARDEPTSLLLVCAILSLAVWLAVYLSARALAPRIAYPALPAWFAAVGAAFARIGRSATIVCVAVVLVSLNAWTLAEATRVHTLPFLRFP